MNLFMRVYAKYKQFDQIYLSHRKIFVQHKLTHSFSLCLHITHL